VGLHLESHGKSCGCYGRCRSGVGVQRARSNASQLRDQTAGEDLLGRSDMELDVEESGIQSRPPEMRNGEWKAECRT
jgi:hypothetical protein